MAITVITRPQALAPAYNANYWYLDSTNKTELGFRYLVEVEDTTTTDVLGTYSLRPIPVSNYGEVDVAKLLQTALSIDFQPSSVFFQALKHRLNYRLNVSEEYFVNIDFTYYGFAGAFNWSEFNNPVINPNALARTTIAHATEPPYLAGDIINVVQTSGNFRPELEGIQTVLDVELISGTWFTILSLPWIGSGAPSSGTTSYADGKKTIVAGSSTVAREVFRGAFSFMDFRNYDHEDYELNFPTRKLLTTLPAEVRISRNKPTWLAGFFVTVNNYIGFVVDGVSYRYALGAIDGLINFDVLPSDDNIEEVFSGGSWIPYVSGLNLSTVDSYTVNVALAVGFGLSETITINLYDECDYFETVDVCFLDRLGSWITIPFNKAIRLNTDVERKTTRRKYGGLVGEGDALSWGYDSTNSGEENYHVEEVLRYSISTGQLNETESQYMRELLSTPKAFVSLNGGDFQAINIQSTSLALPKKRTDRERKVTIEFTMSVQDEING